jgi:hypothetical protein
VSTITRIGALLTCLQDFRFGLRLVRKDPGFAITIVLMLALGIGANTAIFTFINAIMLRTLPVQNPERLFIVKWIAHKGPTAHDSYFWGGCPAEKICYFADPQSLPASFQNFNNSHGYPTYTRPKNHSIPTHLDASRRSQYKLACNLSKTFQTSSYIP